MSPSSPVVRVRILTLGCKVNQCDAEEIARALAARGYEMAPPNQPADVYVVNTCTVTGVADAKARKLIRRVAREYPEATLIVTGCAAQRAPGGMDLPGVTAVVPNTQKGQLPELIASLRPMGITASRSGFGSKLPKQQQTHRTRAFVKLQDGCDHRCAYCAVPDARGAMVSTPLRQALAEIEGLAAGGVQEVVLCGIRLGAYGREDGRASLSVLLHELRLLPLPRVRLSSIEPMDVDGALLEELADHPTLCRHLHLPLQSGDDEVLAAMGRSYRAEGFAQLVARVRRAWSEAAVSTDVIVGFPGETETQFERTMAFLREQRFSRVHVFPYSPRAGTRAAERPDTPAAVKTARTEQMLALSAELADAAAREWVGRPVPVLVEERDRVGLLTGLTEHYLRVRYVGPEEQVGRVVTVTPERAEAGELYA